jgi:hypothetical protein
VFPPRLYIPALVPCTSVYLRQPDCLSNLCRRHLSWVASLFGPDVTYIIQPSDHKYLFVFVTCTLPRCAPALLNARIAPAHSSTFSVFLLFTLVQQNLLGLTAASRASLEPTFQSTASFSIICILVSVP